MRCEFGRPHGTTGRIRPANDHAGAPNIGPGDMWRATSRVARPSGYRRRRSADACYDRPPAPILDDRLGAG